MKTTPQRHTPGHGLITAAAMMATLGLGVSSMAIAIDDDHRHDGHTHEHGHGGEHHAHAHDGSHDGHGEHDARRHDGRQSDRARTGDSAVNARVAEAIGNIAAGLENGELSTEEAIAHLRGLQRRLNALAGGDRVTDRVTDRATDRAPERTRERRQRDADPHRHLWEEYRETAQHLREAVASGAMSERDAQRRLDTMRSRIEETIARESHETAPARQRDVAPDRRDDSLRGQFRDLRERLAAAVAAGQMTEDQASKAMDEFRQRMSAQRERGGDRRERERPAGDRPAGDRDINLDQVRERLHHALESGRMSEEQAKAVLRSIEDRLKARGGGH